MYRCYFRLKLSPTSSRCPRWLIFFRGLFYQSNCKEAMNRRGRQIRGALCNFFVVKKCLFVSSGCIYNRFLVSCHEQVCLIMFNKRYYFERYFFHHWAIVGTPPPPFCSRGLSLQPNFQKKGGGLTGPQLLDGGC